MKDLTILYFATPKSISIFAAVKRENVDAETVDNYSFNYLNARITKQYTHQVCCIL